MKREIIENSTINISSIFTFTSNLKELTPFLAECQRKNCTVIFENEDLIVAPDDSGTPSQILALYRMLVDYRKPCVDYMHYAVNLDKKSSTL